MASEIHDLIPHRPPFLWVDRIVSLTASRIEAEKHLASGLDFYQGHYPNHPLTPGVILCEAVFQAGALLIAHVLAGEGRPAGGGLPVLTRIHAARFKRPVPPGSDIAIEASLVERLGPAWLLKGRVRVQDQTVLTVEFACAETVPSQGR